MLFKVKLCRHECWFNNCSIHSCKRRSITKRRLKLIFLKKENNNSVSGWPVGAVLAQACHAATAAIHLFYRNRIIGILNETRETFNSASKEFQFSWFESILNALIFLHIDAVT